MCFKVHDVDKIGIHFLIHVDKNLIPIFWTKDYFFPLSAFFLRIGELVKTGHRKDTRAASWDIILSRDSNVHFCTSRLF